MKAEFSGWAMARIHVISANDIRIILAIERKFG
jgi:hypothetical protein